jgi:hypothetical protein
MLEDRLDYLCRAVETLCTHHELCIQDLIQGLIPADEQIVRTALQAAAQQIRSAGTAASARGDHQGADALSRISQKVTSASQKEKAFGLATKDLLDLYVLPDARIVDDHYLVRPRPDGKTWADVLSYYRGAVLHEGYLDIAGGKYDREDIWRVINHLHDVLVRILFKMLGYDGTYDPAVGQSVTTANVDWVSATTPAASLGYQ